MNNLNTIRFSAIVIAMFSFLQSCNNTKDKKAEELTMREVETENEFDSLKYSLKRNTSFNQLTTSSNSVLLTGIDRVRLLTIYKVNPKNDRNIQYNEGTTYSNDYEAENENEEDLFNYFMPGIDIINGYNMINVGHYDLEKEKMSYLFQKPVLIKTLYFPGVKKDSLNNVPIKRNFFMVSVYDEDTNKDSLINKKDLRKIYHFDELNSKRTQLIPNQYSAIRSTYDYKNDIYYIYSRFDSNKNGKPDKNEPVSIFWIRLSEPTVVKKMI
ncbi:MAG TPA: hypothetical protein VLB74_03610 [Flavobacterium sp.]|uniref:hypothetical protein n=1 Tax=Flavobacterium sp. TaxID=239 RepID=UPI002C8393C2|nr:hypothetical protein [Flavobacterium sp.]HSD13711.1 hypothetical protein [Flavobacterium sp.]